MTIEDCNVGASALAPCTKRNSVPVELVVFDFDETVVACNSDTFINQLAPDGKIPEEIWKKFLDERDWTAYMQQVFAYLHKHQVSEADYNACMQKMPFVAGMRELFQNIRQNQTSTVKRFDAIILSDANSYFISYFLKFTGFDTVFRKIFTNPAHFDSNGHLQIQRYHVQNWCKLSARNLCKGHVLKEFLSRRQIEDGVTYSCVNYVGDGQNDYCPSLVLSSHDRVFPRAGYPLDRCIKESKDVKANVHPFVTGHDISKVLFG